MLMHAIVYPSRTERKIGNQSTSKRLNNVVSMVNNDVNSLGAILGKMNTTLWDVQEALKHENVALKALQQSASNWREIIVYSKTSINTLTTEEYDWKVRFECQKLYNDMLLKQTQRLRTEIRMAQCGIHQSADVDFDTVGKWRTYLRKINIDKCSLKSLRDMYERQLDIESMNYYRARDALKQLTKDMRYNQTSLLREQERSDLHLIPSLQTPNTQRTLKPIAKIKPMRVEPRKTVRGYKAIHLDTVGNRRGGRRSRNVQSSRAAVMHETVDIRDIDDDLANQNTGINYLYSNTERQQSYKHVADKRHEVDKFALRVRDTQNEYSVNDGQIDTVDASDSKHSDASDSEHSDPSDSEHSKGHHGDHVAFSSVDDVRFITPAEPDGEAANG